MVAYPTLPDRVVQEALAWCGTPYQHQASLKGEGTDCLGLLRGIYRALYAHEPRVPPPYGRYAKPQEAELLREAAQNFLCETHGEIAKGQVLLFQMRRGFPARHIGIAIGPNDMVHALSGAHVCATALTPWWRRHCVGQFTFPETQPPFQRAEQ